MNDDLSNGATPLDEQLVAYLDGELDAESSRRIDELLATDAEVRRRLQEMERTWDLLDDLDTAPVGGQFAQTHAGDGGGGGAARTSTRAWPRPPGAAGAACWRSAAACWRPSWPASSPSLCCHRSEPATPRRPARAGEPRPAPARRYHRVSQNAPRRRAVLQRGRRNAGRRGGTAGRIAGPAAAAHREHEPGREGATLATPRAIRRPRPGPTAAIAAAVHVASSRCRCRATPSSHAPLRRVVEDVVLVRADGTGGDGARRATQIGRKQLHEDSRLATTSDGPAARTWRSCGNGRTTMRPRTRRQFLETLPDPQRTKETGEASLRLDGIAGVLADVSAAAGGRTRTSRRRC